MANKRISGSKNHFKSKKWFEFHFQLSFHFIFLSFFELCTLKITLCGHYSSNVSL